MFPLLKVTFLILNLWITQSHQEPTGTAPEQTPPVVEVSPVADPLSLLGKPAPALVLNDIDGKSFDLTNFSDEVVVLEWTLPECRFSRRLYAQHRVVPMIRRWGKEDVKWVSIDSAFYAHPEKIRPWVEKYSIQHPYLIDVTGLHAEAFGIKISPTYLVVNRGKVVYHGAIDDDVWGKKLDRQLFLDMAIRDAVAGRAVENPLTRSYGMQIRTRRIEDERRAQIEEARKKSTQDRADEKESDSQQQSTSGGDR